MSNINPIFSIEYPNLDTLLFIRKQYPQLADMEIGTTIVDEECILAHYLPSEDEACEVAAELIYFGTLLASTNHFHRTYDEHELLYRCVNLRHEAKPEQSTDEERVNQVSVEHASRNDVLTIIYPRYKTVFAAVNFKVPNLTLVPQTEVINAILNMLKDKFGSQPELRLYVGEWNVTVHIFDFTSFCTGTNATIEDVVPAINASVLEREYMGEPWVEVKRTDEVLFVNQDDPKSTTLGDLLRWHLANSKQEGESQVETPEEVEQSDEKIKVKIELPKFERVNKIEVKCDCNDVLTITYPRDETVFSNVDFEARSTYFDLQTVVLNTIRDVLKETFGAKPETRLFIGKNNVSFHIFDFNRSSRGTKFTMEKVVSDINGVLLKPEHRGKVEAKEVKVPEELTMDDIFDYLINPKPVTLGGIPTNAVKQANPSVERKPHTGFKPGEAVPLQGGEHSVCKGKLPGTGETVGHVDVAYDPEADQLAITYPLDKTVLSTFNLSSTNIGGWLENITSISDSVRTIIKMEYNLKAEVCSLVNDGKFKIYINDITRIAEDVEGVIKNITPKINALILKPQFNAKYLA